MKTLPICLMTLAGMAAAGCPAPEARVTPRIQSPGLQDTGTPPSTIALEPQVRYYRDHGGAIWDDRGHKVGTGS
jgi:hypothetical protein